MNGERGKRSTRARMRDVVVDALAARVVVESVGERPHSIVLEHHPVARGHHEQVRLTTQEWVQLRLADLEGQDGLVYVARYV